MLRCCSHGVSLTPHPHMADIDKGHMWATVITFSHRFHKMLDLLQIDRIIIIGFIDPTFCIEAFSPCVEHPLRRCFVHPGLKCRDSERDLQSLINPTLSRSVKAFPQEMTLFRLNQGPRQSQIGPIQSREIFQRIGRLQL